MATTVDLASYTLTIFGPNEDHNAAINFSAAERDALETQLKSRGYTLRKSFTEITREGVFFVATRDSDGVQIVVKVARK